LNIYNKLKMNQEDIEKQSLDKPITITNINESMEIAHIEDSDDSQKAQLLP